MRTKSPLKMILIPVLAALALLSCGDDGDKKLYKWSCNCGGACAETEAEAFKLADCVEQLYCHPTGDTCVCPGGASSCAIDG